MALNLTGELTLQNDTASSAISEYMPLYRKYRPQQLSELVGQEAISQTLSNAIHQNRLAHAYLFCGPRGTGKTSSARILAKSINCVTGPTDSPCQTCPSCKSITEGTALDVSEIDAASNNGVEYIRELTERVQFRALDGKYRIYIIDEVHMLSPQAFNALLKTLEEPPPNVVFIFATTEAHKVLPTIVSRCQRFDFSRITRAQIEAHLKTIAASEGINISDEAVTVIARYAKGGMRDALSLLDQVSVLGYKDSNTAITPADIRLVTGDLPEDTLIALTNSMVKQAPVETMAELNKLIEHGADAQQILSELIQHFKRLLLVQTCPEKDTALGEVLDISNDQYALLKEQATHFTAAELAQIISRLAQVTQQLRSTSSPLMWLEVALIELSYRQDIHQIKSLVERLTALEQQLNNGAQPVARPATRATAPPQPAPQPIQPAPATPAVKANLPAEQPTERLPEQVTQALETITDTPAEQTVTVELPPAEPIEERIEAVHVASAISPSMDTDDSPYALGQQIFANIESIMTRNLLEQQCELVAINGNVMDFAFSSDSILKVFNRPEKVKQLEAAITTTTGQNYRVEFSVQATSGKSQKKNLDPIAPTPAPQQQSPTQPLSTETTYQQPTQAAGPNSVQHQTAVVTKPIAKTIENSGDPDLIESKRYTQELLQAKLIET